ncbi:hypothetical protein DY000_02007490 [Brassica cretica]|uniref:Uncharacterized protein n=1 Tax=Brassica cretica TaxID=69181 RepID=A0ABQ7CH90_BRACR|nr:hypothetical protein DY000_02007490 [Brassica cretica]
MLLIKALAEASPLSLSSGSHSTRTLVKDSEPPLQRTLGCRPMLKVSRHWKANSKLYLVSKEGLNLTVGRSPSIAKHLTRLCSYAHRKAPESPYFSRTWNRRFSFRNSAGKHTLHMVMYPLLSFVEPSSFFCTDKCSSSNGNRSISGGGVDRYQVGGVNRYRVGGVDRCRVGGVDRCWVGGVDRCQPLVKFPDLFLKCADRHQTSSPSTDPNLQAVLHPIPSRNPISLRNLP